MTRGRCPPDDAEERGAEEKARRESDPQHCAVDDGALERRTDAGAKRRCHCRQALDWRRRAPVRPTSEEELRCVPLDRKALPLLLVWREVQAEPVVEEHHAERMYDVRERERPLVRGER